MYYAGLRPEGVINLALENVILPPTYRSDNEDWGELPTITYRWSVHGTGADSTRVW